jgi:hypothetical protein
MAEYNFAPTRPITSLRCSALSFAGISQKGPDHISVRLDEINPMFELVQSAFCGVEFKFHDTIIVVPEKPPFLHWYNPEFRS